jgi:hypothetical protein
LFKSVLCAYFVSQRQRNRDNMRKFRKPKAVGRFKKPSDATATKRAAAKAAEADFVSKVRLRSPPPPPPSPQQERRAREIRIMHTSRAPVRVFMRPPATTSSA